jgi:hypothetical protein
MNSRKLILTLASFVFALTSAIAQTVKTQATVSRVTGTATVTLADGSTIPLTTGMKVPQGATITTGTDGDVYLETHTGYVSTIKADSVVTVAEVSVVSENGAVKEERTMLDLKSGNVVALLDPKKKAINNYQVRTPKGVAAARGTTFVIQYNGTTVTVAVVNGVVSMLSNSLWGVDHTSIADAAAASEQGAGMVLDGIRLMDISQESDESRGITERDIENTRQSVRDGLDLASRNQQDSNELDELLAAVVASVAVAAQNGMGGATAADAAAVAQAVFAARPSVAAQAAAMMSNSGVATGAVADAVRATVPPAQQGAFDASIQTGTFQQTTVNPITPLDVSVVSPSGNQ